MIRQGFSQPIHLDSENSLIGGGVFIVIMALYEYLIRRVNVLRFLFGMKSKSKG